MLAAVLLAAIMDIILSGCAKETLVADGGDVTIDVSARIETAATKAVSDYDGNGANVNRCILEIFYGDELYKRMESPVSGNSATFSNVPVVAGKQYQILFWADCGGDGLADKYFATDASLKTVAVVKDAFVEALASGDNDKLDAFFYSDNYTVPQAGGSYNATLKRPFAQLNVITTDVGQGQTVTRENMLPEKVSIEYTVSNAFNVATGAASGAETYSYEAAVYGDWSTVTTTHKELTLSMDYILASDEKAMVDVAFKTKNGETVVMDHSLTNLPYQRNYRTNVKGNLLTTGGTLAADVTINQLSD